MCLSGKSSHQAGFSIKKESPSRGFIDAVLKRYTSECIRQYHADTGVRIIDHVDPTALDQLVTENNGGSAVSVDLTDHNDHQYDVRIQDSGSVEILRT